MTTIIFGIFEEGLVYAIMALGVYITYKILDFPDLSVDGTFPLGAALTAIGIANGFLHPFAALILSFAAGAMVYVVVEELIPEAHLGEHSHAGTVSVMIGFLIMMVLDVALG